LHDDEGDFQRDAISGLETERIFGDLAVPWAGRDFDRDDQPGRSRRLDLAEFPRGSFVDGGLGQLGTFAIEAGVTPRNGKNRTLRLNRCPK
jgi:hypothetical protein